jgi:hypothetical protein
MSKKYEGARLSPRPWYQRRFPEIQAFGCGTMRI